MTIKESLKIRFNRYINKTETCWLWTGSTVNRGYGGISVHADETWDNEGHIVGAHRAAWFLEYGVWPKGRECVLHKCDNPSCVRPSHLFIGTQQDNMDDMINKGRDRKVNSEFHHKAKLTWEEVDEIRKLRKNNLTYKQIGEMYRVGITAVRKIIKYKTWRRKPLLIKKV